MFNARGKKENNVIVGLNVRTWNILNVFDL